ncbi:hypothetical protein D3C71_863480 [compost metagenome]
MQLELLPHDGLAQIHLDFVALERGDFHFRFKKRQTVAAVALGFIQRHVGVAQQMVGRIVRRFRQRDADADGDGNGMAVHLERLAHRFDQAVGQLAHVFLLADVGQHHGELVAAQPGQRVLLAQHLGQALGEQAQQFVAAGVAQRIVHALEVVQVQAQHGGAAVGGAVLQRLEQLFTKQPAVGHAGQRVVVRHVAHLRVGGVFVGDVVGDQERVARARVAAVEHQRARAQGAHAARGDQFFFRFAQRAVRAQGIVGQAVEKFADGRGQALLGSLAQHLGACGAERGFGLTIGQQDIARHGIQHQHARRDVRHHGIQEARQRRQLGVVVLGQLFGADKLLFAFTPFGDVARDFGKTQQRALVVVDGIDHHVGPEQRAVLAHPPPFGFKAALFAGGGQSALRQA